MKEIIRAMLLVDFLRETVRSERMDDGWYCCFFDDGRPFGFSHIRHDGSVEIETRFPVNSENSEFRRVAGGEWEIVVDKTKHENALQ